MNSNYSKNISFGVEFIWIPQDLGGNGAPPYSGMRLSIRWQEHLEAYLQRTRDVQCSAVNFDQNTSRGRAICALSTSEPIPDQWLKEGQPVELINGFRVLAVGKVISI